VTHHGVSCWPSVRRALSCTRLLLLLLPSVTTRRAVQRPDLFHRRQTTDRPTDRRPYLISSAVVMNGRPRDGNTIGRRRRRAGDPGRPAQTPAAVPARLVRRSAPAPPRLASPRPAVNLTTSSARRYVCRTTPARRKDSRRTPSLPCGTYDRCPADTCPRTSP